MQSRRQQDPLKKMMLTTSHRPLKDSPRSTEAIYIDVNIDKVPATSFSEDVRNDSRQ